MTLRSVAGCRSFLKLLAIMGVALGYISCGSRYFIATNHSELSQTVFCVRDFLKTSNLSKDRRHHTSKYFGWYGAVSEQELCGLRQYVGKTHIEPPQALRIWDCRICQIGIVVVKIYTVKRRRILFGAI